MVNIRVNQLVGRTRCWAHQPLEVAVTSALSRLLPMRRQTTFVGPEIQFQIFDFQVRRGTTGTGSGSLRAMDATRVTHLGSIWNQVGNMKARYYAFMPRITCTAQEFTNLATFMPGQAQTLSNLGQCHILVGKDQYFSGEIEIGSPNSRLLGWRDTIAEKHDYVRL